MTPEERIAKLEAELARERARADGLQEIVHALTVRRRTAGAERQARYRERHLPASSVTSDVTVTRNSDSKTPPPSSSPFPSSFPPSPDPSSPYPLSFPPSSPSPVPPPPSAAPREDFELEAVREKPAKKAKEAKKPTDPRHAPLTQELCEQLGWPHHGGRTAKAISQLLELAAQAGHREDAGYHEVVRRAAIARVHVGFPTVRELHELVTHWGHFAEPQRRGAGPPDGIEATPPDACAGCGRRGQGGSVGDPEVWLGYECGCLPAFAEAQSGGLHFTKAAEWAAQRRAA